MDQGLFDRSRPCPNCGKNLGGYTGVPDNSGARPTPGSVAMCWYCGVVLVLTESLGFRFPTVTEMVEIQGMSKVKKMVEAWKELHDGDSQ